MQEAIATDLANTLSAGRAASHEVVSAPLGNGQMGLPIGGGVAVPGESPAGTVIIAQASCMATIAMGNVNFKLLPPS